MGSPRAGGAAVTEEQDDAKKTDAGESDEPGAAG
jgi:hypothetical protein